MEGETVLFPEEQAKPLPVSSNRTSD